MTKRMTRTGKHNLGMGSYTIPEAAKIIGADQSDLRRWLSTYWDDKFLLDNESKVSWGKHMNTHVNFYTMIEMMVFDWLRKNQVSAQGISRAYQEIKKQTQSPFPFASNKLLLLGKRIIFEKEDLTITAEPGCQLNLSEIIYELAEKLEYGSDGIVNKLWPCGKDSAVVVDPEVTFGAPIIKGTRINTYVIYSYYKAGDKIKSIAEAYDIPVAAVKSAIKFHEQKAS